MRMRFTEYVTRFVRLASRYEEEITGTTAFGFPSLHFSETPGRPPKLGSGIAFSDDTTCLKELAANSHRIEAWRKTNSYKYLVVVRPKLILSTCSAFFHFSPFMVQDYAKYQANNSIKGFDILHQLFRLRYNKNMLDSEALAIMRSLADGVKTYDQVVEVGPNAIVLLASESFANAASCIASPWRRVDVSRILPVSSKGSHSRMHCKLVQPVTCLPSEL